MKHITRTFGASIPEFFAVPVAFVVVLGYVSLLGIALVLAVPSALGFWLWRLITGRKQPRDISGAYNDCE
jgi:hypothetical protein